MDIRLAAVPIIVCTALLAACSDSDRIGVISAPAAPASGGPRAMAPPVSLSGRWTLSATGSGSCAMTFGASQQDSTDGTIAPGGGCPFSFFTSRKWTYTDAGLTIRDHTAQPLAQLTAAGPNRFEGKTGSGQEVALSR